MPDPLTPEERKAADGQVARIAAPYVLAELAAVLVVVGLFIAVALGAFR